MKTPYEVALLIPEFAPGCLSAAEHIAAEVRFAAALERACEGTGGVLGTYVNSEYRLEAWANEEITHPDDEEPDTEWKAALRVAEETTWRGMTKPAGAQFDVRVHAPPLEYGPTVNLDEVPF